jgi:hypothetical protein
MRFAPINAEFAESIAVTGCDHSRISVHWEQSWKALPPGHASFVKIAGPTMGFQFLDLIGRQSTSISNLAVSFHIPH